eukprot:3123-Eustigmatos_ZCMA.PRE.1
MQIQHGSGGDNLVVEHHYITHAAQRARALALNEPTAGSVQHNAPDDMLQQRIIVCMPIHYNDVPCSRRLTSATSP